jgi:hypothetical protein
LREENEPDERLREENEPDERLREEHSALMRRSHREDEP